MAIDAALALAQTGARDTVAVPIQAFHSALLQVKVRCSQVETVKTPLWRAVFLHPWACCRKRLRPLTVKMPLWRTVFFCIFSQIVVKASGSRFAAVSGWRNTFGRVFGLQGFLGDSRQFEGETGVGLVIRVHSLWEAPLCGAFSNCGFLEQGLLLISNGGRARCFAVVVFFVVLKETSATSVPGKK